MKLSDFDYQLPPELIARYPLEKRSASRLLCLDRKRGGQEHRVFSDLPDLLLPGDLLVCNDTRVIPARLFGKKPTGGRVEILIERILDTHRVLAHVRGGKSINKIHLGESILEVTGRAGELFELTSAEARPVSEVIEQLGEIPLPPYLHRTPDESDLSRYQTVFAEHRGSVAAPTAGLHFDEILLDAIQTKGVKIAHVTLHIGAGTFAPVRTDDIREHTMHSERIEVSPAVCDAIMATRKQGGRVIAVGTTALRSLESVSQSGEPRPFAGDTSIFIWPGYGFKCVDALITNFHLPRSTLLMLVSAFAGHKQILDAYAEAIAEKYRFYSYGDAMMIS